MGFGNQLITGVPDLEVKIYAFFFFVHIFGQLGNNGDAKNGYMMGM
jgi:hypothetical protein